MMSKEVVAAVTYNPLIEKFLVLKRSDGRNRFPGCWEFASGFIEDNESVEDAALRELEEETGLKGEVIRNGESLFLNKLNFEIHPILLRVNEKDVCISKEHSESKWATKISIEEMETVPKIKENFEKLGIK